MTSSAHASQDLLNVYEAAALVGMSPELLLWLTKNPPKHGSPRKLQLAMEKNGLFFFERAQLIDFDNWLKLPWPVSPKASRPHIPVKIREEIKVEAGGDCAICHGHADSCEAAHLDPVHKSKNNHPENLLWLCSNHHTKYDKDLYGPKEANKEFMVGFKSSLAFYKKQFWRMQGDASGVLYSLLSQCATLEKQLKSATTSDQVQAVEKLAKDTVKLIPQLAPVSKEDPDYGALVAIKPKLDRLAEEAKSESDLTATFQLAHDARTEFVAAAGFVPCPLCTGRGYHNGSDCPVCNGDREVRQHYAKRVDLEQYENVTCPLCKGKKHFNGEACPVCTGEGELEQRFADEVDVNDYSEVDCPICKGSGRHNGDDCRECGGEGRMERRHAAQVDTSQYETVDCPICKGSGRHDGDDCRECGGEGRMDRHRADQVDHWQYKHVPCPVCRGDKSQHCEICDGQGTVPRWRAERID